MIIIVEDNNTIIPDYISFTVYINIEKPPSSIYVMNIISGWIFMFNSWDEVKNRFPFIEDKHIRKIENLSGSVEIEYWVKEKRLTIFGRD